MDSKAKLLQKVKALAEKGFGGEKENAQAILARLMHKYGITEAELNEDQRECAWFPYSDWLQKKLLAQIITKTLGKDCSLYKFGRKKTVGAYCTTAERIEIEANYEFFKVCMTQELDMFFTAFIHVNDLFPPDADIREADTAEEAARAKKAAMMMMGMETYTRHKGLPEA